MQFRFNEIHLQNVLSFGPDSPPLKLENLNVFIGPNASGKSNLLDVINLLRCCPTSIAKPIRETGGIIEWIWKGKPSQPARITTVSQSLEIPAPIRHRLALWHLQTQVEVVGERVELVNDSGGPDDNVIFRNTDALPEIRHTRFGLAKMRGGDFKRDESVLSQVKDMQSYRDLTALGRFYEGIQVFRDWTIGRRTMLRQPQPADLPGDCLLEDCTNLGVVLNSIAESPKAKAIVVEYLRKLYQGIDNYHVRILPNYVQVILNEGEIPIPATRLSDGTLRYLCLLAILCHPTPPPVICIEEPEIGLHPDIINTIAELLKLAAQKSQLFITTHSDILVDALTDTPESIVVCEKENGSTTMRRLEPDKLTEWLEKYRLGELWMKGNLGGTRW